MSEASGPVREDPAGGEERKPYVKPVLTLFGHVAALTQGSNCSANNDGAGSCPSTGGSNMGMTSDRRLKQDIVRIGEHPGGFGLYLFRYREGDGARHFGVMADEVAPLVPQAVRRREDGFLAVDYRLLGIRPALH